jgi:phage terminase small subunit
MPRMNHRHRLFAAEYIIDFQGGKAAVRAGYEPKFANQTAYRLLGKPEVQALIREQLVERTQRTHITQDRVLQELARLAFFDPRRLLNADGSPKQITELDDDTAAAIAGLDVLEQFEGTGDERTFVGYVKKYKISDKNSALTNAMKHLGLLKESLTVSGPNDGPIEVNVTHAATAALSSALKERLKRA